jgi:hypothetical protein
MPPLSGKFTPYLLLIFLLLSGKLPGQVDTTFSGIAGEYTLDSVVVAATRRGFDVGDFIRLVQEDKTFFQAFRNLRFVSYTARQELQFFDRKKRLRAAHRSGTRQISDGRCREMEFMQREDTGDFLKRKGAPRYYTAQMFDRLFYTHSRTCDEPNADLQISIEGLSGMEKHVAELKKLIFQPGMATDVPFIGDKTAIFSEKMADQYQFTITSAHCLPGRDCYVFAAKVKPEVEQKHPGRTVVKYLETWFEKGTLQVLGRRYHLLYLGWAFDFDVLMDISLTKQGNRYLPEKIEYRGRWDIPAQKPEIAEFWMEANFSERKN